MGEIINKIVNKDIYEIFLYLKRVYLKLKTKLFYSIFLKSVGKNTFIDKPLLLSGMKYVQLGRNVIIFKNCRIELIPNYGNQRFEPQLIIGDYTQIHQNAHITCSRSITVGKNVVITSNVTITDINHLYTDIDIPINLQQIQVKPVEIGDQSYVYNNSVILPGVKVGKHCVIAANSVVSRDIPDYSIVAGNPAKIIKRFNTTTNIWEKAS